MIRPCQRGVLKTLFVQRNPTCQPPCFHRAPGPVTWETLHVGGWNKAGGAWPAKGKAAQHCPLCLEDAGKEGKSLRSQTWSWSSKRRSPRHSRPPKRHTRKIPETLQWGRASLDTQQNCAVVAAISNFMCPPPILILQESRNFKGGKKHISITVRCCSSEERMGR